MNDLISKTALITDLAREYATGRKTLGQVIDEQPTIKAKVVIRSEWEITDVDHAYGRKCYHCPECGWDEWRYESTNYCPNCGIKMDGVEVK